MAQVLKDYDRQSTVSLLSALLTLPSLQANTLRIEAVLHLSVAYCAGTRTARRSEVAQWLNNDALIGCIKHLEDPASDVFVTNVETADGNRRIIEGDWSSNAYYVQCVLDTIAAPRAPRECTALHRSVFALLKLSEEVAERLKLKRWSNGRSLPYAPVALPSSQEMSRRAQALEFTDAQLDSLEISKRSLAPFILRDEDRNRISQETLGHTTLERRPIVSLGEKVLLAVPAAVSPAIRRFVITMLLQSGKFRSFEKAIGRRQATEVEHDCLLRLEAPRELVQPPSPTALIPSSCEWLIKYDENKYVHAVLLHDDGMREVDTRGLCAPAPLPETSLTALEQHIGRVAKRCQSTDGFSVGWSLVVVGGVGRARMLDVGIQNRSWHVSAISVPDFVLLCSESERPLRRFLKFLVQKRWATKAGMRFGPCSDYELYTYWHQNGYQFLHRPMSTSSPLAILVGGDISAVTRKDVRRSVDPHVAQIPNGGYCGVFRFTAESLFEYQRERPVYLSKVHFDQRVLAAVVETSRGPSWLVGSSDSGEVPHGEFVYQFFQSFVHVYERLVEEVESHLSERVIGPLEICLNLNRVAIVEKYADIPKVAKSGLIDVSLDARGGRAILTFPPDTLLLFNQVENTGERLVLSAMARGLIGLHAGSSVHEDDAIVCHVTEHILDAPGARLLHVFAGSDPIQELLMAAAGEVTFLSSEDYEFCKLELSNGRSLLSSSEKLASQSECTELLNGLAENLWKSLKRALRTYNRDSLVRRVLAVHEAAISDRYHWRRTARALLSLHSTQADVFTEMRERESFRTNIQLPARTIVEMAVCESPVDGGRDLSTWDVDSLLAKTRLLLQIATDSDAIYHGLAEPSIELHANGEYSLSSHFYESTLEPFVSAGMRDAHEKASQEYDRYYRTVSTVNGEPFTSAFTEAFSAEFGIGPKDVVECIAELVDWSNELQVVVVETTVGAVKHRLMKNRELSLQGANAFVRSFGLFPRESWDKPPPGFNTRDIWPWRYSRRLSVIARPLVVWGKEDTDKAVFGIGTLVESLMHVTTRAAEGRVSQNFFTTREMLAYLGEANNRLGRGFNEEVAQELRQQGWHVREEVAMTELGASETLGDVDVLAWTPGGDVQIIECKRLQLARTVAEVSELCKRFRGEENDNLRKHVRRAEWIRSNPTSVRSIVGYHADPDRITDRIVTNVRVPMTYLTSLPVDSSKIGPLC